jgi:rSAM/selenodomain-associated transferase 1
MRHANHLVVFVKAPRLGAVKRRLAADIGAVCATAFYRRTLASVLARLRRDRRWRLSLAVTPDRDAWRSGFWPDRLHRIPQGTGDLGKRIARVMAAMPPGPVVVVGSDVPDLDIGHVAPAFHALGRADAVFGPAPDGGYWLVGLKRRRPLPGLFDAVRWSTEHALCDTLANLPPGASVAFIETLEDIDDGAAFARWRASRSPAKSTLRPDRGRPRSPPATGRPRESGHS